MNSLLAVAVAITLAPAADAQMMGGSRTMGRGTVGSGDVMQMASVRPVVAPDGTVLVTRYKTAASSTAAVSSELVAISPAGTALWKWAPPTPPMTIEAVKNLVLVSSMPSLGSTRPPTGTETLKGKLTALSLATGAVAWSLELDGVSMGVTSAEAHLYVVVMKPTYTAPTGTPGGMMGGGMMSGGGHMNVDATLSAISLDGHVLWTLPLRD